MRHRGGLGIHVETVRSAAATCLAHPLRSVLGALAIGVAVATLTLVDAALAGLTVYAQRTSARAFGSDTFVVARVAAPGQVTRRELRRMLERNPPLRRSDYRALQDLAGGRAVYAATAQRRADVSSAGRTLEGAVVTGTGASLAEIRDLGIARGRFFLPEEERRAAAVALIGADVADRLFPGRDALGSTLRIAGRGFDVIGVQERLGTAAGVPLDRYVWIPLPAWERAFGPAPSLQVSARAPGEAPVERAEDRARATLRARRSLRPGEADDFEILTPEGARSFVLALAKRIGAAAPPIWGMALLAAVVVVTNGTLVSVAQRTREIGVRRALGATRAQVEREVIAESALISLAGGLAGLLVAAAVVAALPESAGVALRGRGMALGLAASLAAGVLAGFYPARHAARLDVVAALRTE